MSVTVLVEPDPGGHRYQAVATVASVARRHGDVLLLTSTEGAADDAFANFLAHADLEVETPFDQVYPPTRAIARAVADVCRRRDVSAALVMDADTSLKRWWYVGRQELRALPRRPRILFMLTRYPARLGLGDWFGWRLRLSKGTLVLLAMATGTLQHASGFAGRDDLSRGWVVRRARDPETCTAHSRDRTRLRAELGLPADRTLVGVCGVLTERRNAPMILDAIDAAAIDADLLLAGSVAPDVSGWLDGLAPERRSRVIVRDGFLPDDVFDRLLASVDVAPVILTNNGPSGIMGKALAAGVPVVTAGSRVRAKEIAATGGGEAAALDVASIAAALQRVLAQDPASWEGRRRVPPATPQEFAEVLLGLS